MDMKALLLRLCAAHGSPGDEGPVAALCAQELAPYGAVTTDTRGNVFCHFGNDGAKEHVLLDAHLDQIGMVVTQLDDAGFLQLARCGGVDRRVMPGALVTVYGAGATLAGVVCCTPPHLADGKAPMAEVDKMYVDCGLSAERAKELVSPGDRVLWQYEPKSLLGGRVCSGALDNRAGCAALIRCAELLKDEPLNCAVTVQLSVQEEVGGNGAGNGAFTLRPTKAIVVDVSFAEQPGTPKPQCGTLGGGPMLGVAPVLSRKMGRELNALAEKRGMPHKWDVMGGDTGTNSDAVATARGGAETMLVSIPLRYMHTPIEVIDVADVENTALLLADYVKGVR